MKVLSSLPVAVVAFATATTSVACGGAVYALEINGAAGKLAEARELGAEKIAPFPYYFASEHLTKARSEAAEGDYSDAIKFAAVAQEYADKAIEASKAQARATEPQPGSAP